MHEIGFRGKNKAGQWVYGYYVQANDDWHFIVQMNCFCELLPNDTHEVDPKTVGQYTGLLDIHGKEIYEKDKVKWASNYEGDCFITSGEGVVEWDDGGWIYKGMLDFGGELTSCEINNYNIEVIGNIHEGG